MREARVRYHKLGILRTYLYEQVIKGDYKEFFRQEMIDSKKFAIILPTSS